MDFSLVYTGNQPFDNLINLLREGEVGGGEVYNFYFEQFLSKSWQSKRYLYLENIYHCVSHLKELNSFFFRGVCPPTLPH